MSAGEMSSSVELLRMSSGAWVSQALAVAAKLRVADLLIDGPRSVEDLAEQTATDPSSLYRLLRALASVGLFVESEGRFGLTPLGEGLRSDIAGSVRAMCEMRGAPWFWDTWGQLEFSVTTGRPAFDEIHGTDLFTYLDDHAEARALFAHSMSALSAVEIAAVVGAYDFPATGTVIDVGGSHGALMAAVLRAQPALRGVLFDRPATVANAAVTLDAAGVAGRCDVVGGDFFETVPQGGDVYLLKSVIHDWDDGRASAILASCRRAMTPKARLLIIERIVPAGNTFAASKWMDLNMLVAIGGRERTEEEYRQLCGTAGLTVTRVLTIPADVSLIEAASTPH